MAYLAEIRCAGSYASNRSIKLPIPYIASLSTRYRGTGWADLSKFSVRDISEKQDSRSDVSYSVIPALP